MFKITISYINMELRTFKAVKKKELRKYNQYSKDRKRAKDRIDVDIKQDDRNKAKLISYCVKK